MNVEQTSKLYAIKKKQLKQEVKENALHHYLGASPYRMSRFDAALRFPTEIPEYIKQKNSQFTNDAKS